MNGYCIHMITCGRAIGAVWRGRCGEGSLVLYAWYGLDQVHWYCVHGVVWTGYIGAVCREVWTGYIGAVCSEMWTGYSGAVC